jgi:hypothetical protein
MELRDLVLSTLEELDDRIAKEEEIKAKIIELEEEEKREIQNPVPASEEENRVVVKRSDDELAFLRHTKERLEILFEGLKSSEIKDPEAKLELTLKYLQLLLAQVDERVAEIKS